MNPKAKSWIRIAIALLYIALGVAACLFSTRIGEIFHFLIGGLTGFAGLLGVVNYFSREKYLDPQNKQFIISMLNLVIAILILAMPSRASVFICVVWGISSILKSIFELNHLVQRKVAGESVAFKAAFSILELCLGIVLLLELTNAIGHHVLLLGFSMISRGAQLLPSGAASSKEALLQKK